MNEVVEVAAAEALLRARVLEWVENAKRAATELDAAAGGGAEPGGEELVHAFRVALRRLRSVLRWFEGSFGKRKMRALGEELREVAGLTGELRDEEVLRETLRDLSVELPVRLDLDRWMVGRRRREHGLRRRATKALREARLGVLLERLGVRLRGPLPVAYDDAALADDAIHLAIQKVERRADGVNLNEVEAAHSLRIAWKQLRYSAELCAGIARSDTQPVEKIATKLQKHLGRLHDLDQAAVTMDRARGLPAAHRRAVLAALSSARARAVERCQRELGEALERLRHRAEAAQAEG